ncbi:adenylate kinase [Schaalia sp. 19OD2882]|uniref:adenylate kinase n=1 Tax=Schaalia sp. 19OD2882 TaxID=2794089 RepID=UPI001C1EEDC8|nr:adenylate kinase [Schaalia sp. 19OD2882]QWW19242.1 adenylate kinase [Schaalia sp. 19OD2882]
MTSIILLGAPGAGKGTQARLIAERLGIPAISTGEIFRTNMASDTELGRRAREYMDRGEFVPDSVTNPMVQARLAAPDTERGFLLDGYPRTLAQAHVLRDLLVDMGKRIDVVLAIEVDENEVVERILKRAQEQHRSDDTEEIIRHRLEVYHKATEPIATYYADQDLLESVDGSGTVDQVFARICEVLDRIGTERR